MAHWANFEFRTRGHCRKEAIDVLLQLLKAGFAHDGDDQQQEHFIDDEQCTRECRDLGTRYISYSRQRY
ncbi:hypothetical protein D3C78_1598070 [compost metagenome]